MKSMGSAFLRKTGVHSLVENGAVKTELLRGRGAVQDDEILELRGELSTRPSAKQWEDLRKQVKILQVLYGTRLPGSRQCAHAVRLSHSMWPSLAFWSAW